MNNDGDAYSRCANEIKQRLLIIQSEKDIDVKFTIPYIEFNCLQFRKICELVALSSLTANRSVYEKIRKDFSKDWNFNAILKVVGKVNPDFFPIPISKDVQRSPGKNLIKIIPNTYLDLEGLINLYDESSEIIHAQNPYSISNILTLTKNDFENWWNKFTGWKNNLIGLLDFHLIGLVTSDSSSHFLADLNMERPDDDVIVYSIQK